MNNITNIHKNTSWIIYALQLHFPKIYLPFNFFIYMIIVNLCESHFMYFLINQSRKKCTMSLTLLLISIIVCIHIMFIINCTLFVFDQIMQTLILVPLNPLSETLVTLCGLRGGAAGYPGRGCAHARCSPLWKSLVLSQTVWVDLVHQWRGDIGHRSFVLYISSALTSSVRLLIPKGLQKLS